MLRGYKQLYNSINVLVSFDDSMESEQFTYFNIGQQIKSVHVRVIARRVISFTYFNIGQQIKSVVVHCMTGQLI